MLICLLIGVFGLFPFAAWNMGVGPPWVDKLYSLSSHPGLALLLLYLGPPLVMLTLVWATGPGRRWFSRKWRVSTEMIAIVVIAWGMGLIAENQRREARRAAQFRRL